METILIRGGRIITAADDYNADIFIVGDQIEMIGRDLPVQPDRTIDARGQYVIPGGIDAHTHMELPVGSVVASDDFETGTIAAAHGGTTTIIDFATQAPGGTLHAALDTWLAKAEGKAVIDYGMHMIISDLPEERLAEMDALVREGVTSFKMFTAYPERLQLDDGAIFEAMQRTRENGGLVMMHAENGSVIDYLVGKFISEGKTAPNYHLLSRPHETEADATQRVILLAQLAGVPVYIVHVSSHLAMQAIRRARRHGLPVFGETCPQYLALAYEQYADGSFDGAKFICSPPIRERANQEPLWEALARDDLQTVATDHCPFWLRDKELGRGNFSKMPNGVPGVENRMHIVYQGGVVLRGWSMNRMVQVSSTVPAKLFGLFPRKGAIAVGSDADIVLWDPERKYIISAKTQFTRVDYNPYEGVQISGSPSLVMARGRVIFENDVFLGKRGQGEYLRRGTYRLP